MFAKFIIESDFSSLKACFSDKAWPMNVALTAKHSNVVSFKCQ